MWGYWLAMQELSRTDCYNDDDNSPNYSEVNKKFERVGSRLVLIGSGFRKRSRDEDSYFSPEEEESDQEQLQRRTK